MLGSLLLAANGTALEGRCPGFAPDTTLASSTGYAFVFLAVFCFGTNYIPTKQYKTGDGMFFQWVMASAIWTVGFAVDVIRGSPKFHPYAVWGGVLWATANVFTVAIFKCIGLAVGMLIMGSVNMMTGWGTGTFGWFGLKAVTVTDLPRPTENYIGVALACVALSLYLLIKTEVRNVGDITTTTSSSSSSISSSSTRSDGLLDRKLRGGSEDDEGDEWGADDESNGEASWTDDLPHTTKRVVGVCMCVVAGFLQGSCFDPGQYIMDHNGAGQEYEGASSDGLDYVFAQFCGIYLASTFWFLVYCLASNNKPQVYPELVGPTVISGWMWAVAQTCWFVANTCLGFSVSFPLITSGPGVLSACVGIYYGEIRGGRNFAVLAAAFAFTVASGISISLSHA